MPQPLKEDLGSELLRARGYSFHAHAGEYGFPRVNAECTFKKILDYDAPFTMRVTVGKVGRSSIRYEYQFFTQTDPPELAAEGSMTVVVIKDGKPVDIPAELRAAVTD